MQIVTQTAISGAHRNAGRRRGPPGPSASLCAYGNACSSLEQTALIFSQPKRSGGVFRLPRRAKPPLVGSAKNQQDPQMRDENVTDPLTAAADLQTSVPIALMASIPKGSAHPVLVGDTMLALWRDETGGVHVWEDRCPHRGMRLSFGFVRGDRLSCLYHGWQFGRDGGCKYIPAHPEMTPPQTITVKTYPSVRSHGMVLVGAEQLGSDHPEDRDWHGVRSVYVNQRAADLERRVGDGEITFADRQLERCGPVFANDTLALGIQAVGHDRAALHLSSRQSHPEERVRLARELVGLREALNREAR